MFAYIYNDRLIECFISFEEALEHVEADIGSHRDYLPKSWRGQMRRVSSGSDVIEIREVSSEAEATTYIAAEPHAAFNYKMWGLIQ